jgi:hypothetical protein
MDECKAGWLAVGWHALWFWREKIFKYPNAIFAMKLLAEAFLVFAVETVRFVNLMLDAVMLVDRENSLDALISDL